MSAKLETLSQNLQQHFGDKLKSLKLALGELTIEVSAADYLAVMTDLRVGPTSQAWLATVGIWTLEDLQAIGAVEGFGRHDRER